MYSVVLMAALTVTPATPAFHHRGCGCYGGGWGYSCAGCYGGGWGYSCCGCYGGGYSCYGCYGSSWGYSCMGCWGSGSSGCWGSGCYGCWGGWGYSCCGCSGGGWGCGGGYGYVDSGVPVEAAPPAGAGMGMGAEPVGPPVGGPGPAAPAGGTRTAPGGGGPPAGPATNPRPPRGTSGGTTALSGSAKIVVQLPKGAKLYVDDHPMSTPTGHRTFTKPSLDQGQAYYYIFRAEAVRNGKVQSQQKRVIVRAGDTVRTNFDNLNAERTAKAN